LNRSVQAIIFDLDDTLVLEEPSAANAFMDVCKHAEQHYGVDANKLYNAVRIAAREIWHQSPAREYCLTIGISSWEGLWARFEGNDPNLVVLRAWSPYYRENAWKLALKRCSASDTNLAIELAALFKNSRRKYHVLYADVVESLDVLSKYYRLAILTNGVPDLQREKIDTTGIAKYFAEIVISGEIGYGKPDQRIYQIVLSRLGTAPEFTWNIGDSLERDIQGAQAVGIKAAWINRSRAMRDEHIKPDMEISSLRQFINALK